MAYDVVDGKVVRLVPEDVDAESHDAELQADLEAKQEAVNATVAEQTNVETELADLEALADAKANQLEDVKTARESAEAELAKSVDLRGSFLAAIELANREPIDPEADGDGENVEEDDDEPAESEAVDVPINVSAVAEG